MNWRFGYLQDVNNTLHRTYYEQTDGRFTRYSRPDIGPARDSSDDGAVWYDANATVAIEDGVPNGGVEPGEWFTIDLPKVSDDPAGNDPAALEGLLIRQHHAEADFTTFISAYDGHNWRHLKEFDWDYDKKVAFAGADVDHLVPADTDATSIDGQADVANDPELGGETANALTAAADIDEATNLNAIDGGDQ